MSKIHTQPYPSEFRESSVRLAIESEIPISHTARNLGIAPSTLSDWIKKSRKSNVTNISSSNISEVTRLKKELNRVQ